MRHAVLGAGGIGGLLAAALARAGDGVVVLLRPSSLASYPGRIEVDSVVLGSFAVDVPAADRLEHEVDVVWVATKAAGLQPAISCAPPAVVSRALVIPLLNGADHIALLRQKYAHVCAGTISVEAERTAPGRVRQLSPFLRVELAPPASTDWSAAQAQTATEQAAAALRSSGITAAVRDDEASVIWDKLAFLAPIALATTALDQALGAARTNPHFLGCQDEVLAIAHLEGATTDGKAVRARAQAAPADMRSSMQKDVAAGRPPELDAIAGAILRRAQQYHVPVPHTRALTELIQDRISS